MKAGRTFEHLVAHSIRSPGNSTRSSNAPLIVTWALDSRIVKSSLEVHRNAVRIRLAASSFCANHWH